MSGTRIIVLCSPLLLAVPTDLFATRAVSPFLSSLVLMAAAAAIAALSRRYAEMNGRDGWFWARVTFIFPMAAPIVLALLPEDPHSATNQFRQAAAQDGARSRVRAVKGSFEQRFPLLTQCLAGQPQETQEGLRAHFSKVKANFEFLLGARPDAVPALLEEARYRGLVAWTGSTASCPVVYGAGLVRPSAVEETREWLAKAGATGHKLTMAFHDSDGMHRFSEYHFHPIDEPGSRPNWGLK